MASSPARDAARLKLGEMGRARRRGFDQAIADRVIVALHKGIRAGLTLEAVLAADPGLPSRPTLTRWRRENREFDRVLRMMFRAKRALGVKLRPVPQVLVDEIVDHLVQGGSFASYSALPGGPSRTTLRRWFHADPAFAEAVTAACEWREDWYDELIVDAAMRMPPGPVREMARSVGPLKRHLVRLRHRPGAVHRPRLRRE